MSEKLKERSYLSFWIVYIAVKLRPVATFAPMTEADIIQIQNEIFTKIVIDELQKQKVAGKPISEYVLDKYAIDQLTKERLKKILSE